MNEAAMQDLLVYIAIVMVTIAALIVVCYPLFLLKSKLTAKFEDRKEQQKEARNRRSNCLMIKQTPLHHQILQKSSESSSPWKSVKNTETRTTEHAYDVARLSNASMTVQIDDEEIENKYKQAINNKPKKLVKQKSIVEKVGLDLIMEEECSKESGSGGSSSGDESDFDVQDFDRSEKSEQNSDTEGSDGGSSGSE